MIKKLINLVFLALIAQGSITTAAATGCLNTHIDQHHDDYGDSSGITPRIMKEWENWCARGYTAQQLDAKTQQCVTNKANAYREEREKAGLLDMGIRFDVLQEFSHSCRTEFLAHLQQTKRTSMPDEFNLLGVIDDPDGYTNVRSLKNAKSQIVTRVVSGEQFFTYRQDSNWWQVRTRGGKVGYMHVSRIRLID